MTDFKLIERLAAHDVATLIKKGETYGDSWKKRGGVGAYMVGFARKVDRIENICRVHGYDIFEAAKLNTGDILDDIRDLRAYLLLIEAEVLAAEPAPAPVNLFDMQNVTTWKDFVFEGAQGTRDLYTCKLCKSAIWVPATDNPYSHHACAQPSGYVNQDR